MSSMRRFGVEAARGARRAAFVRAAPHRVCVHADLDAVLVDASPRLDCQPIPCAAVCLGCICCEAEEPFGRRDEPDRWAIPHLLARVRDEAGVLWGWRHLDDQGCTGEFDTSATSVDVDYLPWAHRDNDKEIVGLDCDARFVDRCEFSAGVLADQILSDSGLTRVAIADLGDETAIYSAVWATSFAEERVPLFSDVAIYLITSDTGPVSADRRIGEQPTVNLRDEAYRRKFTLAHEYGHVQTIVHPTEAGIGDVPCGWGGNPYHTLFSAEWQSLAAAEGFAHYYAMLVWWSLTSPGPGHIRQGAVTNSLDIVPDEIAYPRFIDNAECGGDPCPSGVANEVDWMAMLWNLTIVEPAVVPPAVLALLATAYPWPATGKTDAYWQNFRDSVEASGLLSDEQFTNFLQVSTLAGVDR